MNILGIFHSAHDPSVALFIDGKLHSFAEEERFTRIKHSSFSFPTEALKWILDNANIKLENINEIVQAWDCILYDNGYMQKYFETLNKKYKTHDSDLEYQKNLLNVFKSDNQKKIILGNLKNTFGNVKFPKISFVQHHLSHSTMAYFHSGMEKSLVFIIDGSGEWSTMTVWKGIKKTLTKIHEVKIPHSLGWFYSAFTEFLGFKAYDGEYKVMGLAAYGKASDDIRKKLEKVISYDGCGGFESNPLLLSHGERTYSKYFPDSLVSHMGFEPRNPVEEIQNIHKDLAYELQQHLENIVKNIVKFWIKKTNIQNVSIAGGVGLNIKMNSSIRELDEVDNLFVHPLSSDAGSSIGACMAYLYNNNIDNEKELSTIYLGPKYTDDQIEKYLNLCKINYKKYDEIVDPVSDLLYQGKVIGWFQGAMEAGPRALGNRSILGDSSKISIRDKVNGVIKYREMWRPFCPSMAEEVANKYVHIDGYAPFMIQSFRAKKLANKEIPAVVHIDKTCRIQTVNINQNELYYKLLKKFGLKSNNSVLLNTSFNVKGEPIVCTPIDAIRTFFGTGMDALAIGNFLVLK